MKWGRPNKLSDFESRAGHGHLINYKVAKQGKSFGAIGTEIGWSYNVVRNFLQGQAGYDIKK